ncbi:hypothetical protein NMG60_11012473 [Bertholletia excelsa]
MMSLLLPLFLQQTNQQPGDGADNNHHPQPPPVPGGDGGTATGPGGVRPGSMAERARLAKVPQPDAALKCPRCESSNTKFCYYNNYSLSQPRHFCKTCRRYWTRGGALRNVPVGGGCRRNKRSKAGRAKSPAVSTSSSTITTDMPGHLLPPPSQLTLLPSLPHLSLFGGLDFPGAQPPVAVTCGTDMRAILSATCGEQWKVQNFPFSGGLEQAPHVMYPFEGGDRLTGQIQSKPLDSGVTQMATVKIEENHQGINLSSNLGLPGNNDQYWGGNAWSDLPGFTSSAGELI